MATPQRAPEIISACLKHRLPAGIDEVGRGSLAGPVIACAVILPPGFDLPDLRDSKELSQKKRAKLDIEIRANAMAWGFGIVWPKRIDQINILQATLEAMAFAASSLNPQPDLLMIDGNRKIPSEKLAKAWRRRSRGGLPEQIAITGGDRSIKAISAASILAKVFRDRLMTKLGRLWAAYNFEKNKGYGTKEHLEALRKFGACPMHRLSFGPSRLPERLCLL